MLNLEAYARLLEDDTCTLVANRHGTIEVRHGDVEYEAIMPTSSVVVALVAGGYQCVSTAADAPHEAPYRASHEA